MAAQCQVVRNGIVQVLPQLDREPRDLPRLVPADPEGRTHRLQGSGLPVALSCMLGFLCAVHLDIIMFTPTKHPASPCDMLCRSSVQT